MDQKKDSYEVVGRAADLPSGLVPAFALVMNVAGEVISHQDLEHKWHVEKDAPNFYRLYINLDKAFAEHVSQTGANEKFDARTIFDRHLTLIWERIQFQWLGTLGRQAYRHVVCIHVNHELGLLSEVFEKQFMSHEFFRQNWQDVRTNTHVDRRSLRVHLHASISQLLQTDPPARPFQMPPRPAVRMVKETWTGGPHDNFKG